MKQVTSTLFLFLLITLVIAQNPLDQADGDVLIQQQKPKTEFPHADLRGEALVLPAGDAIEGDYIGQMVFTQDGEQILVPHRTTNNVSVFDWSSQSIVADIPVGQQPIEVITTADYALVPCYSSDELYIVNLADYSVAAVIPTAAQPNKVRVSRNGAIAAVACDESDVLEVIDLNTLSKIATISSFESYIYKFSFITSSPRNTLYWNDFEIAPDGSYIIARSENSLRFYNSSTGSILTELENVPGLGAIGMSGDGQRLVTVDAGNSSTISLIGLDSIRLIDQITIDQLIPSAYSPIAVNMDGNRAFLPGGSGTALLVRFDQGDVQVINTTSSPNWVGTSADRQFAVSGQFYLHLIDFDTGDIVSLSQGRPIQNGVMSPMGKRLVACDPLRFEGIYFYDFENANTLTYLGKSATGSELEADVAYSARFSPDGKKLLIANSLSGSLSVIDVEEESPETIIPFSSAETYEAAITSDNRYALMAKRLDNQLDVIDLETMEIVKSVPSGGSKPGQVFVLPGDAQAYVLNSGGTDAIGVVNLDGSNSQLSSTFPSGNTGISWTNYGIRSDFKITPDGAYSVLATPFSDAVKIIRLSDHQIVADIALESFPLQIAISKSTDLGFLAAVTLKNDDAIAIIGNIGEGAAKLGIYPCGSNPTRIAYDPSAHQFAVCSNDDQTVEFFDPENLVFVQTQTYGPNHTPIAIDFDEQGNQYTLLRAAEDNVPHQLAVNEETFDLPALPIHHFDVSPDGRLVAVTMPGSDEVFLLKQDPITGVKEVLIQTQAVNQYQVFPNPSRGEVQIMPLKELTQEGLVNLRLYDNQGKLLLQKQDLPASGFELQGRELKRGLLTYQLWSEEGMVGFGHLLVE
ncbi:MAG: hypothetical protein AAFP19_17505 [Bacteroidota bacterium]